MKYLTKLSFSPFKTALILFAYLFTGITGEAQTTTFTEQDKVISDAALTFDGYGYQVDIDNDFAVVSEIYDDYDENEMNNVSQAGKINVLKKVNGQWQNIQNIVSINRYAKTKFIFNI